MAERGTYLGDVTALHLLQDEANDSRWIAVGIGGVIRIHHYDPEPNSVSAVVSVQASQGARIHGLCSQLVEVNKWIVVSFGDRNISVWLFLAEECKKIYDMIPTGHLPRFNHWVMDVAIQSCLTWPAGGATSVCNGSRLAKSEEGSLPEQCIKARNPQKYLAVGLSNNSLEVWSIAEHVCLGRYLCSMPALLYSMKLNWNEGCDCIQVISGTAFRVVLFWMVKVGSKEELPCKPIEFHGHEGSIHRVLWDGDGRKIASASDDRTIRIWSLPGLGELSQDSSTLTPSCDAVLYGHTGRVWDLDMNGNILVSASEDGTIRIWGLQNKNQLCAIRAHGGRGAWRCLLDSTKGHIFSGGADASVKRWEIESVVNGHTLEDKVNPSRFRMDTLDTVLHSTYEMDTVNSNELSDSSAEYVRCLFHASLEKLFLGTNHGKLIQLNTTKGIVEHVCSPSESEEVPASSIMSLYAISHTQPGLYTVITGDIVGKAKLWSTENTMSSQLCCWVAHAGYRVLGVSLHSSFVFGHEFLLAVTLDSCGKARVWKVKEGEDCFSSPALLLHCLNLSCARFTCASISPDARVLVLGDQKGGVTTLVLADDDLPSIHTGTITSYLRNQHAKGAVTSAAFLSSANNLPFFCTRGHDGSIRYYSSEPTQPRVFRCAGMERVSNISMILEHVTLENGQRLVAGFHARDFLLLDVSENTEILRVSCGGWRRPVSFHHTCSENFEVGFVFSFLKDGQIHTYYNKPKEESGSRHFKRNGFPISKSHHGREIHAACFVPDQYTPMLLTGAEDGYLRCLVSERAIGKYIPNSDSQIIGEHAAGTAVKAIDIAPALHPQEYLLVSGGAKEVFMLWHLTLKPGRSLDEKSYVSAMWLSTREPRNGLRPSSKMESASQHRTLSLSMLTVMKSPFFTTALIASGSSDSSVSVLAFETKQRKWAYLRHLACHRAPVLAVKLLKAGNALLLFSSSSEGDLCLWDLHDCLEEIDTCDWKKQKPSETEPFAILNLPGLHQSGLNSIAAFRIAEKSVLVAGGGEDHQLSVTQLLLDEAQGDHGVTISCHVVAQLLIPTAHMSSIRSLWTDGDFVFSAGLDQRLRAWKLGYDQSLTLTSIKEYISCTVEVPELEAMSAWSDSENAGYFVAVSGRGTQTLWIPVRKDNALGEVSASMEENSIDI